MCHLLGHRGPTRRLGGGDSLPASLRKESASSWKMRRTVRKPARIAGNGINSRGACTGRGVVSFRTETQSAAPISCRGIGRVKAVTSSRLPQSSIVNPLVGRTTKRLNGPSPCAKESVVAWTRRKWLLQSWLLVTLAGQQKPRPLAAAECHRTKAKVEDVLEFHSSSGYL